MEKEVSVFTKVDQIPPSDTVQTSERKTSQHEPKRILHRASSYLLQRLCFKKIGKSVRHNIKSAKPKANIARGRIFIADLTAHKPIALRIHGI